MAEKSQLAVATVGTPPGHPLFPSLVRLFHDESHDVVGAGFLAAEGIVLTCAHVVNAALGFHEERQERPGDESRVTLDFPYLRSPRVAARVDAWRPIGDDEPEDVAVLAFADHAPDGARATPMDSGVRPTGRSFEVCGFPAGNDAGAWARGVYVRERADGTIQLEGPNPTGYRIQPGFSGAPVWDLQLRRVTGMVVLSERLAETKVAFMIPTRLLSRAARSPLNIIASDPFEQVHPDDFNKPPEESRLRRWVSSLLDDR